MTKYIYDGTMLLLCYHPDDYDIKDCLWYYELQGYEPIILAEFIGYHGSVDDLWLEENELVPGYTTGTGQKLFNVHSPELCEGRNCVIHNPSDHSMRDFKTYWREDRGIMERICPHGIGHPDPDDHEYQLTLVTEDERPYVGVHGCDGCCRG